MDNILNNNESLSNKVAALEKKVQSQDDEIIILKTGLSEALRKLAVIETAKGSITSVGAPKQAQLRHSSMSVSTGSSSKDPKPPTPRGSTNKQPSPAASPKALSDLKKWPNNEGSGTTNAASIIRNKTKEKNVHDANQKETVEGCLKIYLRSRPLNFVAPTSLGNDFLANFPSQLPKERLTLEWVYGYRGKDARSNIFLLPTGEIVYFVAAVAVLYNIEVQTQRHYVGHTDDIRCMAVHPDKVTIATGQVAGHDKAEGKPHVRIWNSINLTTLKIIGLGEFDKAVACLSFSKDGKNQLVVVDDSNDHSLTVWDWQKGEKGTKLAENKSSGEPVFFAEFHPCESNSIVLCGKGQITFWTFEGSVLSKKGGIFEKQEKPKFVTCLAFTENGEVISGDSSGNICIWGKGTNKIQQAIMGAHEGGLFTICSLKDGTFISGGKDRKIIKWNFSDGSYKKTGLEYELPETYGAVRHLTEAVGNGIFVGTTKNAILQGSFDVQFVPVVQGHADEVWGLAEHPNQNQFITCGRDKLVYMWDSLTHRVIWSKEMPEPCHAVAIHPNGQLAVISGISPRWYVLDLSTHEMIFSHSDAGERVECFQFSPVGDFLVGGSRDNFIYVYSVSEEIKFYKIARLSGHSSFVLHLDWSADGQHLQSNSGDYELLFWNMVTHRQVLNPSSLRDIEWASNTCTLSFSVCGIWPEGADGTDINACVRSRHSKLLATADDFGKVSLLSYPCFQPRSQGLVYQGHSSHVTNVKFLHDDTRLISVGGKDSSVMQWQVIDPTAAL